MAGRTFYLGAYPPLPRPSRPAASPPAPGSPLPWVRDDGGRSTAPGFGGTSPTGDCVVRAISIATGRAYHRVYADITSRSPKAARRGVPRPIIRRYMADAGWVWVPTMGIGTGCTVHLAAGELPADLGPLVVSLSRHLCAVVDGVVRDTHDPGRQGTRCVYGYWHAPRTRTLMEVFAEDTVDTLTTVR